MQWFVASLLEALEDNVALKELDLSSNEVLGAWAMWGGLVEAPFESQVNVLC